MNKFLVGVASLAVLTTTIHAAKISGADDYRTYRVPDVTPVAADDADFQTEKKAWGRQKRKLASNLSFSAGDLSPDYQRLRDEWLAVKTGDEMEALLRKSAREYDAFSEDARYFLSQLQLALPLRGIVWRLRPLFESKKGFLGNKSTHVTAVQAIRTTVTALKLFLPTQQTDAAIQFFTEPSAEMGKADQFQSMAQFQQYLMSSVAPALDQALRRITEISKNSAQKMFVWDNKMTFGRGSFGDDLHRFKGNGAAEIYITIAALYRAYHDVLLYCAYNQNYAITLAGELGTHFGIDSSVFASRSEDVGITDQERVALVRKAAQSKRFLELRNYGGTTYGTNLLKEALDALRNSVVYAERSYDFLQMGEATKAQAINPIVFQPQLAPNLDAGVRNMKAAVRGPAEIRDPVTGDTVTVDLPAFYLKPPASLAVLLPTAFETGDPQKVIRTKKGEELKVLNYLHGRSVAWDNNAWKKYVPSAEGKNSGYMAEARRILRFSFGTSLVFGAPDFFVH
jgi:hypothetical protein